MEHQWTIGDKDVDVTAIYSCDLIGLFTMVYEPLFVLLFSQGDFGLDGAAGYSGPVGMRVSDFPLTRKISVQKPFSRKSR